MAINDRVLDYQVATLANDVVDYRRVIRITAVSGEKVFLAFPDTPPADWLQFSGGTSIVYLPAADFDATYRLLREESPVFVTAFNLFGLRAYSLNSGAEAPGQSATDPQPLVELMARAVAAPGDPPQGP
jgi:hypothetical protein